MASYYEEVCKQLNWQVDQSRLTTMKEENKKKLKELEDKIKDAEENLGEIEIRDAHLDKAEFYVTIGDKVCYSPEYLKIVSKQIFMFIVFSHYTS